MVYDLWTLVFGFRFLGARFFWVRHLISYDGFTPLGVRYLCLKQQTSKSLKLQNQERSDCSDLEIGA